MWLILSQFEGQFLLWLQEVVRRDWLSPLVAFYTTLGNSGLLWIALCLGLLLIPKTRRAGAAGLLALLCSLLLTNVLIKHLAQRTRPWLIFDALVPLVYEGDPNSFPSGHTSAAFAAAIAWFHTLPKRWMRLAGLAMAALMGLSRLYVGVHFPSDVLCGALVGTLCGFLGWKLLIYIEKRSGTLT
mgnify:CR=1 FL=1